MSYIYSTSCGDDIDLATKRARPIEVVDHTTGVHKLLVRPGAHKYKIKQKKKKSKNFYN